MNIRSKLLIFLSVLALIPVAITIAFAYYALFNQASPSDLQTGFIVIFILSVIYILVGIFSFSQIFMQPIITLTEKTNRVIQGDLSQKIEVASSDEVGKLADSFNKMTTQLSGSYGRLEQKVEEKTAALNQKMKEMERINKYMIGRELRMIDLKKQVTALTEELSKTKQPPTPPTQTS